MKFLFTPILVIIRLYLKSAFQDEHFCVVLHKCFCRQEWGEQELVKQGHCISPNPVIIASSCVIEGEVLLAFGKNLL